MYEKKQRARLILRYLRQKNKYYTKNKLAEKLSKAGYKCSEKTVHSDIQNLIEEGYKIDYVQGYILNEAKSRANNITQDLKRNIFEEINKIEDIQKLLILSKFIRENSYNNES